MSHDDDVVSKIRRMKDVIVKMQNAISNHSYNLFDGYEPISAMNGDCNDPANETEAKLCTRLEINQESQSELSELIHACSQMSDLVNQSIRRFKDRKGALEREETEIKLKMMQRQMREKNRQIDQFKTVVRELTEQIAEIRRNTSKAVISTKPTVISTKPTLKRTLIEEEVKTEPSSKKLTSANSLWSVDPETEISNATSDPPNHDMEDGSSSNSPLNESVIAEPEAMPCKNEGRNSSLVVSTPFKPRITIGQKIRSSITSTPQNTSFPIAGRVATGKTSEWDTDSSIIENLDHGYEVRYRILDLLFHETRQMHHVIILCNDGSIRAIRQNAEGKSKWVQVYKLFSLPLTAKIAFNTKCESNVLYGAFDHEVVKIGLTNGYPQLKQKIFNDPPPNPRVRSFCAYGEDIFIGHNDGRVTWLKDIEDDHDAEDGPTSSEFKFVKAGHLPPTDPLKAPILAISAMSNEKSLAHGSSSFEGDSEAEGEEESLFLYLMSTAVTIVFNVTKMESVARILTEDMPAFISFTFGVWPESRCFLLLAQNKVLGQNKLRVYGIETEYDVPIAMLKFDHHQVTVMAPHLDTERLFVALRKGKLLEIRCYSWDFEEDAARYAFNPSWSTYLPVEGQEDIKSLTVAKDNLIISMDVQTNMSRLKSLRLPPLDQNEEDLEAEDTPMLEQLEEGSDNSSSGPNRDVTASAIFSGRLIRCDCCSPKRSFLTRRDIRLHKANLKKK